MKSKFTSDFKRETIDGGYVKRFQKIKKEYYYDSLKTVVWDDGLVTRLPGDSRFYSFMLSIDNYPYLDCAARLVESRKKKVAKIREKLSPLVMSGNGVFVTLTFSDEVLANTSAETRRRYVARFLKKVSGVYCANIDYSPENNREHYHGLVVGRFDLKLWQYGFIYAEKVRCHPSDIKRVSNYITKFVNHALKVDSRLIYSRN